MALNSKSAPPRPPSPKHEFKQQKHDGKNILIISVSCDLYQNPLAFRLPIAESLANDQAWLESYQR